MFSDEKNMSDSEICKAISFPLPDDIFKTCIEKFNSLPPTGKPTQQEWTVLSCIIKFNHKSCKMDVVSLGTGTKCIGQDQLCPNGFILNDSHAEIMARRGFLRYLYSQMNNPTSDSCLSYNDVTRKYQVQDEISFHFFSTHAPCGDATIVSNTDGDNDNAEHVEPLSKKQKRGVEESTDNFTGAKLLLADESADLMSQEEGVIRTKPGRGVRTLSVSCSDKLSRWNILGIQGSLLCLLLDKPIYLETFTFCRCVNEKSLQRAIFKRWVAREVKHETFQMKRPTIRLCSAGLQFQYAQSVEKNPSPASIVWCDVKDKQLEVAVAGKRQGATKSKKNTILGALRISKRWLLNDFLATASVKPSSLHGLHEKQLSDMTYNEIKSLSKNYQQAWNFLKEECFRCWTKKPNNLQNFKIKS